MLNTTFALYIQELGGSEAVAGLVAWMFSLASVSMRPILGWMLDKIGRGAILLVSLAGLILLPAAYSFVNLLWLAIALRILHGMVWSGAPAASNTAACDVIPKARFAEGMGIFGTGAAVSMAVGPLLGIALWEHAGQKMMFWTSSLFMLASLLIAIFAFIPVEKKVVLKKDEQRPRLLSLVEKTAIPASFTLMLFNMPYGCIVSFIALYGIESGIGSGGLFFALMAGTTVLTRLFFGGLADKRGELPIVIGGNLCVLIALLLLAFGGGKTAFMLSALIYGLGFGIMPPTMQALAMRNAAPQRRGAASATFLCAFDIGIGLGGLIAGMLIDLIGYNVTFLCMIAFLIISVALFVRWADKTNSRGHISEAVD